MRHTIVDKIITYCSFRFGELSSAIVTGNFTGYSYSFSLSVLCGIFYCNVIPFLYRTLCFRNIICNDLVSNGILGGGFGVNEVFSVPLDMS